MNKDIYVYNSDIDIVGVIDKYSSIVWNRKYFEAGTFEIVLPATKVNSTYIQKRRLISRAGDNEVGLITSIEITDDKEKGKEMKVGGIIFHGILRRRIIYNNEKTLANIIQNNIISAPNTERNIPNFVLDENILNLEFDYTIKGSNVAETIIELAKQHNFGQKTTIDKANKRIIYTTYFGVDRSAEQSENPRVIFSKNYDNLLSATYTYDEKSATNTMIANWDNTIKIITDGTDHSGYDRFETYREFGGTTSLADITKQSKEALQEITEDYEGDVSFNSGYKTKWDLGDIVTVFDVESGFTISKRITEVSENCDKTTNEISCVFGTPLPTLSDKLKKIYKRGW